MRTKNFVTFTVVFGVVFLLIDRLVISRTPYLRYLDLVEFGFELNRLAKTMQLQDAVLFIGIVPLVLLGTIILYSYVRVLQRQQITPYQSFATFLNFFIAVVSFNVLGGIIYYICSITPWVKVVNEFLSDLILVRVYINFPLLAGFNYKNAFINFSFANAVGLYLLRFGYFESSVSSLLTYFDK